MNDRKKIEKELRMKEMRVARWEMSHRMPSVEELMRMEDLMEVEA